MLSEVLFDIDQKQCQSVFVTRDKRDFQALEIVNSMADRNCKLLFSFRAANNYILHELETKDSEK